MQLNRQRYDNIIKAIQERRNILTRAQECDNTSYRNHNIILNIIVTKEMTDRNDDLDLELRTINLQLDQLRIEQVKLERKLK